MKFSCSVTVPSAVLFIAVASAASQTLQVDSKPISIPDSTSEHGITLDAFNKIMFLEASNEFGVRRLSYEESASLWESSAKYDWTLAEDFEVAAHLDLRRLSRGRSGGALPYVVCDMNAGKPGEDCRKTIEQALRTPHMIPLYNKADMTCFAVEAVASTIRALPKGVSAMPFSPEMKMVAGLAEFVASSDPMVSRLEAVFCAGETDGTVDDAKSLATNILHDMSASGGRNRKLRADAFLNARATRDEEREYFWRRQLENLDDEICQKMMHAFLVETSGNSVILTLPSDELDPAYRPCLNAVAVDLASQPEVCFVGAYQNIEISNIVASGIVQSGSKDSKPFYDVGLDGRGQVVSVSDTGIDVNNCYFLDANKSVPRDTSGSFNHKARKVVQYYALGNDSDQANGHGTHVAGTIAGRRAVKGRAESDGDGDGIAKGAKLAFFDLGDSDGQLHLASPNVLLGTGYSAGARIHSASWGATSENRYTTLDASIDQFMYDNTDFLFISAAGNQGNGNAANTVNSPGNNKNGITVGASENDFPHSTVTRQGADYIADFSSRGPTADGRIKPEIVAPGWSLLSARAMPNQPGVCDEDGALQLMRGTSMATPIVSGTAALIRQYFVEGWHLTGSADPTTGFVPRSSLVKATILNGGDALLGIENDSGVITPSSAYDMNQGFGRVNLLNSVPLQGKNQLKAVFINSKEIKHGGKDEYNVNIDTSDGCNAGLSATLVWTDPPGGAFCNSGCVLNDLELKVTRNDRRGVFYPNGLTGPDSINNVERVQIKNAPHGASYTISVAGSQLIQAQDYSLVITGCITRDGDPADAISPPAASTNPPNAAQPRLRRPATPRESATLAPTAAPTKGQCVDSDKPVLVAHETTQNCAWLASNLAAYEYLCEYLDVVLACPVTCNACLSLEPKSDETIDQKLDGANEGDFRWFGSSFDVKAKHDLTVTTFDIMAIEPKAYPIEVYTRPSSGGGWEPMCTTAVVGAGNGSPVTLPSSDCKPVALQKGDKQSFYITMVKDSDLILLQQPVMKGSIYDDDNLGLHLGSAVTYRGGESYDGYAFPGSIRYYLKNEAASCQDKPGTVTINDAVGDRSCAWLAANFDRFGYICTFSDQALHCPQTCSVCEQLQ